MWTKVQFVAARSTVAAHSTVAAAATPRRTGPPPGGTAATGGEENGVCQAQAMSPALSEAVWAFYTRVLSAVVSERRCVDWLESVWLGVKVYLTTLLGSEQQTVLQPPQVASVICKGDQGSMRPDGWFHLVVI